MKDALPPAGEIGGHLGLAVLENLYLGANIRSTDRDGKGEKDEHSGPFD